MTGSWTLRCWKPPPNRRSGSSWARSGAARRSAKKKSINTIDVNVNDNNNSELIRLEYPKKREEGIIIGEDKSAVPELIRILREERKLI